MKFVRLLAFAFFLFACQPTTLPTVTIIDNDKIITLQTNERVPSTLLNRAGITLNPDDRVLLNGLQTELNKPITAYPITLQIRRAVTFTLVMPDGEQKIQSSALSVGETLQAASFWLHARDKIDPTLDTPITDGMKITVTSPHELSVSVDRKTLQIQSSARTVGEALSHSLPMGRSKWCESASPFCSRRRASLSKMIFRPPQMFRSIKPRSSSQVKLDSRFNASVFIMKMARKFRASPKTKRWCDRRRRGFLAMGRRSRSRQRL